MRMDQNKTFTTFIFDLDGTVLDTLPDLVVLTNRVLKDCGYPPRTRDEIHSFVGNGVRALMLQAVPEGTPIEDAEKALDEWKKMFPVYPNDLTKPYPHIPELLKALHGRGCKVGLLSNKFELGVNQIIDQYLPGLFDVKHGEREGIPRKPDPQGLLLVIEEMGSEPADTVYVGDSPNDIHTAENASLFGVGVTWGYHTRDQLEAASADMIADDPLDILKLAPEKA